jgi:hypothetical protein
VRNEEECVCSAPNCCDTEQRSASQPGSVASGTRCKYTYQENISNSSSAQCLQTIFALLLTNSAAAVTLSALNCHSRVADTDLMFCMFHVFYVSICSIVPVICFTEYVTSTASADGFIRNKGKYFDIV